MKVFLSSTVYDLIDVRASVEQLLKRLGATPVLSDNSLSAFDATPSVNSIETCLINVERSDAFICVLDQRYGPSLKAAGFDDVSATHLEYRRAKAAKIPILFFVRDRLEADYSLWKRNPSADKLKYAWSKDIRLLEFLDEHRKLENQTQHSNWLSTFTASTDLCDVIEVRMQPQLLQQQLMDALQSNRMPLFDCKMNTSDPAPGVKMKQVMMECRNVGSSPAFEVETKWSNLNNGHTDLIVPPGQTTNPTTVTSIFETETVLALNLAYETLFGIRVIESHEITLIFGPRQFFGQAHILKTRRFLRSKRPTIALEES